MRMMTSEIRRKNGSASLYFSSARKLEKGIYLDGTKIICAADVPVELCDVSELKILGTHNYENVMAASAMAYALVFRSR